MGYFIAGVIMVFLLDLLPQYLKGDKKQSIKASVIVAFCLVICFLTVIKVKIPSPLLLLDGFLKSIGLSY